MYKKVLFYVLISLTIFHIMVIIGIIPDNLVWGSRKLSAHKIMELEVFSLVISILIILISWFSVKNIEHGFIKAIQKIILILLGLYFSLNIVLNIISNNIVEKVIFIPVSILLASLYFILLKEKNR